MYVVVVVDIVMVEPDVVGVALCPILKCKFVAIFDVVLKATIVHGEPLWLVCYTSFMLTVSRLIGEGGGNLS